MTETLTPNDYMTASEAARLLGVSRSAINYFIRVRDLYATKIGQCVCLIRRRDVERLKAKRATR
jgi:excisionase family DNA binding protein